MKKICVLGCGRIGSVIARDLQVDFDVLLSDSNESSLSKLKTKYGLKTSLCDFADEKALKSLISDCDLVISAVPGFMGFETLKHIIETGKDVVDISFFNEDAFELHELALEMDVIAIVDCGVAPGLSNLILGHHASLSKWNSFKCYVGGLPFDREKPFEYKAPFSPIDVIAEYTRPSRIIANGELIIKDALTDKEILNFDEIGELEAFNTDGLRSILKTMQVPNMVEKTLRYPGHASIMEGFREAGLFDENEITINGKDIRPIDLTSKLLFENWKLNENDVEFTVMRIELVRDEERVTYNIFDRTDIANNMTSMARLTGFTCTGVARFLITNQLSSKGIIPPELLANEQGIFDFVLHYMKSKNVMISHVIEPS